MKYELVHGDCIEVLREMESNSVDSIVTDPPYGLSFMAKKWDYDVPSVKIWRECLRVLKPGGHLLSFAGSRTYHRMAVNIEDAGFEIRDQIMWVYGSGFPKSLNISKAIDKAAGAEREVIGQNKNARGTRSDKYNTGRGFGVNPHLTASKTPKAQQWEGWGSALKPAHEPIVVARKPPIGTIVENVLEYGTGGLNIDASRITYNDGDFERNEKASQRPSREHEKAVWKDTGHKKRIDVFSSKGRFPANFIHDGSNEVVSLFPESTSGSIEEGTKQGFGNANAQVFGDSVGYFGARRGSSGSAARFFYCAKASKQERDLGLESLEDGKSRKWRDDKGMKYTGSGNLQDETGKNIHPTVKPVELMRYLCRLITPPNGVVLDPFMGSGTTGIGATTEGFSFIGIEREEEYINIARHRISHWTDEIEEEIRQHRMQKTLFEFREEKK
jgi:DNA modification methylase